MNDRLGAGVQWGSGALGNAVWKGARLRDVLGPASKEAVEIGFDGADAPVAEKTPDFVKSLPVWKREDGPIPPKHRLTRWDAVTETGTFPRPPG